MIREIYRVGIIGAGNVSAFHISALQKLRNTEIIGIVDLDPARAEETASQFAIPWFRTADDLYAAQPDVIHVLTPPSSHCEVSLQALDHGCHVLVEKPMAMNVEECESMIRRAERYARTLSVDHSAKFHPPVQRALSLVHRGMIGEVLSLNYFRSSEYPPYRGGTMPVHYRDGGFPLRDAGVHGLYLIEAFLGTIQDINTSYQHTGRHPYLFFDQWSTEVRCQNGYGHFHMSWTSQPIQHFMSIHGTGGAIDIDLYLGTCVLKRKLPLPKPLEAIIHGAFNGVLSSVQICRNTFGLATGRFVRAADIHCSVRAFYTALFSGCAPPVSPLEGKRIVGLIERPAREADMEKLHAQLAVTHGAPSSILVTGSSGLLGSALAKALEAKGERVRLLQHRKPVGQIALQPNVDVVIAELGDPDALDRAVRGVETVYHIGAAADGPWAEHECGTVCGTRNIVDSCLRHHVNKLIYVSSLSVLQYAGLPSKTTLCESSAKEQFPDRRGYYSKAKLKAEQIVLDAVKNAGLRAVIVRPGSVFGPGAEKTPPYGTTAIGNHWIVMGNGRTLLPLVYIDDLVDALVKSAICDQAIGHIIHIVDPDQLEQREYLAHVRSSLPDVRVHCVPMFLLYGAALGMEVLARVVHRAVPLTLYRLRSIKSGLVFECSTARNILGWTPRVGSRQGLHNTFGKLETSVDKLSRGASLGGNQ